MFIKKMRFIAFTAAILPLMLLALSCGGDAKTQDGKNGIVEEKNSEGEINEKAKKLQPDLPDGLDFGGEAFTFLVTGPDYGYGYYETKDIYAEAQNGETMNDAVYLRNRNVEDRLNINIAEQKSDNVAGDAKKLITSGDSSCDAIFAMMTECATIAQANLLLNIKNMPHIGLDKPWWDKNAERDLSIMNKLYFTTGDISTMVKLNTRILVFNKKLMRDFALGSPYEYVKDDKWTFDVYAGMVKSVYTDVNGNGAYDDDDVYGTIMEGHNPFILIRGFGERLTTNDETGYPQITCNNSRFFDAADKLWDLYFDERVCRSVSKMKKTGDYTNVYAYARSQLFSNDKFLFHLMCPDDMQELRNMESDFGLLPCPKLDENQTRYYHVVDSQTVMLCIPASCKDINRAGVVLEAMAAESAYTVAPALNETLLKRKYIRDDESEFVLGILDETRTYDLCVLFGWGGLDGAMNNLTTSKKRSLAAEIEKIYAKTEAAIAKTVSVFE